MVREIITRVRARVGSHARASPTDGEPIADGGSPKTVCSRRAHAWAGVYAATVGVEQSDEDHD